MSMRKFQSYLYSKFSVNINNPIFECIVIYQYRCSTVTTSTRARMQVDTREWGTIHIYENEKLQSNKYHLRFSPDYQEMAFNTSSETLVIKGSSPKMGGDYSVTIIPTGPAK